MKVILVYPSVRFELLQRDESIDMDPALKEDCKEDINEHCLEALAKDHGHSLVAECLKKHQKELSPKCHVKIFQREKQTAKDPNTDYLLMSSCKRMIKRYCSEDIGQGDGIFKCLKKARVEQDEFDMKCAKVIVERTRQRAQDYRLNPQLQKSCERDIPKFCSSEMNNSPGLELEGKVINCLRIKFAQHRLSLTCDDKHA